ncbi:glycosyltransferase family 4 protein [Roseibacillus ishigakijimensis]|uniref:Glycosyltransferase family 4 protein n=1 Tax=Roseibacillus ishigakijimensis TaxID=454146 RepID=A0A934RMS9_9BACT|nr:glycosyltransferase family 4 protein [Roseibacillus ishigakijimensis]MBK1833678.1 glycosyltransferase family 4 protein [Roseibacillus ishigakijimensis]
MKVLQVLPELNSGGVERGTLEVARHLVALGHQSIVLSHGGRLVEPLEREGSTHLTYPVHKKSLLALRHVGAIRRLLLEHRPDILHLRSRAPAWLCYLAWKNLPPKERPRLVTTVHGFYSVNAYSAVMTRGESVICVSHAVQDYVLKNYPQTDATKLTVIHRGIEPAEYFPAYRPSPEWTARWHEEQPQLAGKTLLTLPGRVTRWKGQEDFLTLLAALKNDFPRIHGLIAGGPHPRKQAFWDELQEKTQELGLNDSVTFLGHRSDLREVLASSDLVFSLSKDPEAFGRVSLEALSLGKPVIAYHHGGVAEQMDALFPAGAVGIDDLAAVESRTRDFLTTPPPPPGANSTFTLPAMLNATLGVYEDLLAD